MISFVVVGRNDDYGDGFRERLFRSCDHNSTLLRVAGLAFEWVLGEWNPLPDRPPLALEFVERVPNARAVIIPPAIHDAYSLNPAMSFFEMPAKNAALRRARGDFVVLMNADILFSEDLVARIASGPLSTGRLYRAHRIDVPARASWQEMQDPAHHLTSAEGRLPPCWYLGAGDFCLASRSLWDSLRGFDERIRFSTRAKDWQLFLAAGARGVDIEFIGDVFHMDHALGIRNTPKDTPDDSTAHYGGLWDVEFGLQEHNPDDWGMQSCGETAWPAEPRIVVLRPEDYSIPASREAPDRLMREWLTRPPARTRRSAAILLHAIETAGRHSRRLTCRLQSPHLAVALSGFAAVAASRGVQVCSNWIWPEQTAFASQRFEPEPPALDPGDWIFGERDGRVEVVEHGSGRRVQVEPLVRPITEPVFDPFLARRLLRAYLRLHDSGARTIAIYGAGSHTRTLLTWGIPDGLQVMAVIVSRPLERSFEYLPVVSAAEARRLAPDAILLSSSAFEPDMLAEAAATGLCNVIPLYTDWPADVWASPDGVRQSPFRELR